MKKDCFNSFLDINKIFLKQKLKEDSICVDATCGNGNDSLFLAKNISKGRLFCFDVQNEAIESTKELINKNNLKCSIEYILDSHENIDLYLNKKFADVIIFNLGYLPKTDHSIVTTSEVSLKAIQKSLEILKIYGVLSILMYPGHSEGNKEKNVILDFVKKLEKKYYNVIYIQNKNGKNNPPELIIIEKRQ